MDDQFLLLNVGKFLKIFTEIDLKEIHKLEKLKDEVKNKNEHTEKVEIPVAENA